ncbi:MAG TPA: FAD-binding protein [Micromonosporaceae bacterium]|nr:FAD-binding protein [Micromonosporaceae bacterium]HCU50602.1 FAD-binding protein [Micromonosporaceae bacterium]
MEADVVVVGFGAAGACAALEAAAAGADVLVLDRFSGGGATALSGGVVYAGGGTSHQLKAGVTDSAEAMYDYLSTETADVVSAETLREFCRDSVQMLEWLEQHGVPFDSSLCPYKTSYPTNRHYLYHSGSELARGDVAPPAARGHRAHGKGTSGKIFFARLAEAVQRNGIKVLPQTTAQQLITDDEGRVVGVQCRSLRKRRAHRILNRLAAKPFLYAPKIGRVMHRWVEKLERKHGTTIRVHARRGVIMAAGGFVNNRSMMREHAPDYRGGLPLGTPGDDGSGINLGLSVGAAAAHLDRVSVWRFLTPPAALVNGVLVDAAGQRVCDESRYGAAIGDAIISKHGGKAWLVVDRGLIKQAKSQLRTQTLWFQRLQTWYLLSKLKKGTPGIDPAGLEATLKECADTKPLQQPYSLIDMSIRRRIGYPAPMLTLGGLMVDEQTGQALRPDGTPLKGLYAAGRNAVGICSNSYVSGLSLADCVFSGRRAGAHAAQ